MQDIDICLEKLRSDILELQGKSSQNDKDVEQLREQLVVAIDMTAEIERVDTARFENLESEFANISKSVHSKISLAEYDKMQQSIVVDITDTISSLNSDVAAAHAALGEHESRLARMRKQIDNIAEPHVHDMPVLPPGKPVAPELARQFDVCFSTLQKQVSRKVDKESVDTMVRQAVARQGRLLRGGTSEPKVTAHM